MKDNDTDLNQQIENLSTKDEIVEVLSQHLAIAKEALWKDTWYKTKKLKEEKDS
jgi:hypothetical protein